MPYHFYNAAHIVGAFMLILSIGGLLGRAASQREEAGFGKKFFSITHGIGMALVLVAGFGLLARLGLHSWPGWVIAKLLLWLLVGIIPLFVKKQPRMFIFLWCLTVVTVTAAMLCAHYKPF